jgi:hypothetical protein
MVPIDQLVKNLTIRRSWVNKEIICLFISISRQS